jgi:putative oxidoreductase
MSLTYPKVRETSRWKRLTEFSPMFSAYYASWWGFCLFGFPAGAGFPAFLSLPWFEGCIEMIGGGLIVIGLFTRFAAYITSGEMAIGDFMVHAPKSFFPYVNGGNLAVLYCFVFFYLVFAGAGPISVDALLSKKEGSSVR